MAGQTGWVQDANLDGLARLVGTRNTAEVLEQALISLRSLMPYDLAAVLRLRGDELVVEAAAGPLASDEVRSHRLSLSKFPTIQRALELRLPVPLEEHHHESDEGDPYDGILDLPHGHSCMVVPLFSGGENLGVITLDRSSCGVYPQGQVDLAGVVGQLVALALRFADQAELLDRYRLRLKEENRLLVEETGADAATRRLEASVSAGMRELAQLARQVSVTDLPVLVQGETGTGKELVCQALHTWSDRREGPYIKLNCAAIPEALVESELFGHVKGAFSGADRTRDGRFVTANGGTLLLDEIGELSLSAQAKLLRVLQEGQFEPVGSDETVTVNVRVLAATHVDLHAAVADGRFRQDLLYRLAVFPLTVPPLRERTEEIAPIAQSFLHDEHRRSRRGPWSLPEATLSVMRSSPWAGNVRELLNALERATIVVPAGPLSPRDLGLASTSAVSTVATPVVASELTWEDNERQYLERLMSDSDGRLYGPGGAAEKAGLKPTTLRSKLVRFGLR
jgi:transcriptional regulator with GAF, ATPase, and Fis domain